MSTLGWLTRGLVVAVSGFVAFVAAAACVLLFLQPWRSCPEIDDSSAGCPALPRDVALLLVSVVVLLVAVLVLVSTVTLTLVKLDRPPRPSSGDDGHGTPIRYGFLGDPEPGSSDGDRQQGDRSRPKRPR
jgi:hypothetical protein